MLLIKTKVKESGVHGLGLFADQFIPKGTEIWRFTPGFDQKFTDEQILNFPDSAQIYLCMYSWKSKKSGLNCFCSDAAKHFNHSENPNVVSEYRENEEEAVTFAIRDIEKGEELLDDYSSFEDLGSNSVHRHIMNKFNLSDEEDPGIKLKKW